MARWLIAIVNELYLYCDGVQSNVRNVNKRCRFQVNVTVFAFIINIQD
jgi:hypothetical protein